jgi:hypothetical protein
MPASSKICESSSLYVCAFVKHQLHRDGEEPRARVRALGRAAQRALDAATIHGAPDQLVVVRELARPRELLEGLDE